MTWMDKAQCKGMDPNLFFEPEREEFPDRNSWMAGVNAKMKQSRALCKRCPVINDCLLANLDAPFGVFGGLSALQRVKLAKRLGVYEPDNTLRQESTPMTSERIALVLDLHRKDHSIADIETLTGINRGIVSRIVHDPSCWEPRPEGKTVIGYRFQKNWNSDKYAEVRKLLRENVNAKMIHQRTGVHFKTVRRIKFSMEKAQEESELANV